MLLPVTPGEHGMQTPIKLARLYLKQRAVSATYAANLLRTAGRCGSMTSEAVNALLRKRLETRSTNTVRAERTLLLCVWKWAFENDLMAAPPKGIMRVKVRKPPTQAWTVEQLQIAIKSTDRYTGRRTRAGAPLDLMMRTWILLAYESGARFGDVWSFRGDQIEGDVLRWTQSKTGDALAKVLSPACLAVVRQMAKLSADGRIIGWACGRRMACRRMREHLDACGLKGTSKWLRRSGATHIEMLHPGKATLHLGHRTPTLAAQAYIDWGQVRKTTPVTPQLISSPAE